MTTARVSMVLAAAGMVSLACDPAMGAGAKWPANDTVSGAMSVIRKATLDNHTLVTHRRMPPADARRFAETVAREAGRIRADAAIPPAAKAEIETLLDEIVTGAEAVAGRGGALTPIDGIVRIDAALARYPQHFEDPAWQPLR